MSSFGQPAALNRTPGITHACIYYVNAEVPQKNGESEKHEKNSIDCNKLNSLCLQEQPYVRD